MSRIFFDTNLFIYLLEDSGETGARVTTILERISERRDDLLTSTLTLAAGDVAWADRYEKLLNTPGVTLVSFDRSCARTYAQLRQDRTVKAPDAIQLVCAASAQTDLFITNDERLSRKVVHGIQFITSLERAFL